MTKKHGGSAPNKRDRSWNSYVPAPRSRPRSPVRSAPSTEVPPHLLGFWSLYHYDITTHKAKYAGKLHFRVPPKLLAPKLDHVVGTYHDFLKPEDHDIEQLTPRSAMGWRLWERNVQRYSVVYATDDDDDGIPLLEMLNQGISMNVVGKRIPQASERRDVVELTDAEWSRFLGMDVAIKLVQEEKLKRPEQREERPEEKKQPKRDQTQSEKPAGRQAQKQGEKREDKPDDKTSTRLTAPKAMKEDPPNPAERVRRGDEPAEPRLGDITATSSGTPRSAPTQKRPRDLSPKKPGSASPRPKRPRESSPTPKGPIEPKSPPSKRPWERTQPSTNRETSPSVDKSKPKTQPNLTTQDPRKRPCESPPAQAKRPRTLSPAPPTPESPTLRRATTSGSVPSHSATTAAEALLTELSHTLLTPSRTCESPSAITPTDSPATPPPALHSERTDILQEITRINICEERILTEKKKHLDYLRERLKLDSEIRKLAREVEEADKVEEESARKRLDLKKQNLEVALQMIEVDKRRMAAQREGRAWVVRVREIV